MSSSFRAVAGRFRRVFLGLALMCTVLPASAARLALVIGVDSYENVTRLKNARADAESMAVALTRAGYEVQLRTDRKLKDLQADLRDFRARIRGGDEVILFFSGHGVQLGGTNYLLPADVGSESEDQVRDEAVALSRALEDLRAQKPRFTLAIIDACRDNPFAGNGRAIGGRGLTGVAGATGQMVIYAAGEGQQALDRLGRNDTARNGVFTRVFLEEMQRPGVPINEVVRNVRERVYELAAGVSREQVPAIYDQTLGRFYFYPPMASVPSATSSSPASPEAPSASSDGYYYLQILAAEKEEDADNMKSRLALMGIDSIVNKVAVQDKTLFRVRIGPFFTEESLAQGRKRLDAGGVSYAIVRIRRK